MTFRTTLERVLLTVVWHLKFRADNFKIVFNVRYIRTSFVEHLSRGIGIRLANFDGSSGGVGRYGAILSLRTRKVTKPKHFPAGFRKTPVNPPSVRDPATATIKTLQITDRNADAPKVTTVTNTGEWRTVFKLKKKKSNAQRSHWREIRASKGPSGGHKTLSRTVFDGVVTEYRVSDRSR